MYSKHIKHTQKRLAQLIDDTLYPLGSSWADIAIIVRSNPQITHYTLSELEDQIGIKGFATLVTVLRLSMPPYNLFKTTFEIMAENEDCLILSLDEYQKAVMKGGVLTAAGQFMDVETINQRAIIHLHVNH